MFTGRRINATISNIANFEIIGIVIDIEDISITQFADTTTLTFDDDMITLNYFKDLKKL